MERESEHRRKCESPVVSELSEPLQVGSLCLVPHHIDHPVAIATADEVAYLLKAGEPIQVLHSIYGQPVTCLDVSASEAACGVKGFGWLINETNKVR